MIWLSKVRCSVDRAVALVNELSSKQHLEERLKDLDSRCARLESVPVAQNDAVHAQTDEALSCRS